MQTIDDLGATLVCVAIKLSIIGRGLPVSDSEKSCKFEFKLDQDS